MMTNAVLAVMFALTLAPVVSAHEGHDHKILGTIAAVHDNTVDVKGADGKTSTISLNEKTKILQGTTAMKAADLKIGDRVVVTATGGGKDPFVAKEVRIGTAPAAAKTTSKK
jgi:hypothetical protein